MKFLKNIGYACLPIMLFSCTTNSQEPKYTLEERDAAVDSISAIRFKEIESVYMADYNLRKSILMKPIIDSLLQRDTTIPTIKNPTINE